MHECPECGQACDCDGEDVWHSFPYNLDCTHECELFDEDDVDEYIPPDERLEEVSLPVTRDAQLRNEADGAGAGESRMIYSCPKCGKPRDRYDDWVQECLHCGDASIILGKQG